MAAPTYGTEELFLLVEFIQTLRHAVRSDEGGPPPLLPWGAFQASLDGVGGGHL